MAFKIYKNDTWNTQKDLRVHNGTTWNPAKRGWVHNGTSWNIAYPEYPSNNSLPVLTVSSGTSGSIGSVYSVTTGSWNSDPAYTPTSYSYQWYRGTTLISGETNSTYTTVGADANLEIKVLVTATNNRGSTPFTISSGVIMSPVISSLTVSDATTTPGAPLSVSLTGKSVGFEGSWEAGTGDITTYEAYTSNGSFTSLNTTSRTFVGTATQGQAVVQVRSVNRNYKISASWTAAAGATSYDVYLNGSFFENTTLTSVTYSVATSGNSTIIVYPKTSTSTGPGATGSANLTEKVSAYKASSSVTILPAVPTVTIAPTISGTVQEGQTVSASSGTWTGSPTSYTYQWIKSNSNLSIGMFAADGDTGSSSYTIPSNFRDNTNFTHLYVRVYATNAGGNSDYSMSSGYAVAFDAVKPTGGTASWTASTVTVGSTISGSTSNWANTPTSYDLRIVRGTAGVVVGETTVASTTNSTISYTIPAGDVGYYYKIFAKGINAGGTADNWVSSAEIGPVPTPVVIPSGGSAFISGGTATGNTISASTSGWSGNPTSYFIKIVRGTANVATFETTVASSFSSSTSYTVAAGDAGYYFRSFATASNSAGSSTEVRSSNELGPATNPVVVTAPATATASLSWTGGSGTASSPSNWSASWSAARATSYEYQIRFSSNGSTQAASTTGSTTSTSLNFNSYSYYYASVRARGVNSAGAGGWSDWTPYV